MDIQAEIKSLKKELDKVEDEHLIETIKNLLAYARKRDKLVGYTGEGEPLTRSEFKEDIDKARQEYREGKYITHEELKEKSKEW